MKMNSFNRLLVLAGIVAALSSAAAAQTPPAGIPGSLGTSFSPLFSVPMPKTDPLAVALASAAFQKSSAANSLKMSKVSSASGLPSRVVSVSPSAGDSLRMDKIINPAVKPPVTPKIVAGVFSSPEMTGDNAFAPAGAGMAEDARRGGTNGGGGGSTGGGEGGCDPVPEPASILAIGLGASVFAARKKKKAA
jgi:hypothetical protein